MVTVTRSGHIDHVRFSGKIVAAWWLRPAWLMALRLALVMAAARGWIGSCPVGLFGHRARKLVRLYRRETTRGSP